MKANQKNTGIHDAAIATDAIHFGHSPDPTTLSRGVPVYRTSSFVFKSAKHAADLFSLKEAGNIYSRLKQMFLDSDEWNGCA